LRATQKPIKEKYRSDPDAAVVTLSAQGRIGEGLTCKVAKLLELTERYCVVYQTLRNPPPITVN